MKAQLLSPKHLAVLFRWERDKSKYGRLRQDSQLVGFLGFI